MPTREERYLMDYGPPPGYGGGYGYAPSRGYGTLQSLLMERGRLQAEAAMRSGDIWGNALANVGQTIAGGIQQHQEQKALKKRDAAWVDYVGRGEWASDPKRAYADTVRIWGPEKGPEMFKGLAAVSQLSKEQGDPEADMKALGTLGSAMDKMTPEGRALIYPQAIALSRRRFPQLQLPEQYDDKVWQSVSPFFTQLAGGKAPEGFTLSPGQKRFDASGKELASAPPEVKEQPGFSLGPGEVRYDASGKPIASRPAAPKEPKAPNLERIETVDAEGKAVTQFVTPTAGASYAKPTGQGKPATGQQRRALNFFNRGKEAGEIASGLEENIAKYNLANQGRLAYEGFGSNFIKSEEQQQYRQAQRAFTEARLRKDSGAAIPQTEFDNDARTYFAQPGDSAATIAQKRAQRNAILASIAFEAGDALREFYGDESEGMIAGYRSASKPGAPGAPKKGERRRISGQLAEWDGQGWLAVR